MKPSLLARILQFILRLTRIYSKRYSGGPGFRTLIARVRKLPLALPTARMRKRVDVEERQLAGRSVWTIAPLNRTPKAHMLYLHGGGYVFPAVSPHWAFFRHMAEVHGIAITAPLYPLAPEHEVGEITAFSLTAYRDFIERHSGPFVLAGDSAGGGLSAATVMAARDAGLRLPDGLVLICPWLDGRVDHPDQPEIERRDCILMIQGARDAATFYARDVPVSDPRVSPIEGNWSGLPPILLFSGTNDILYTDALALDAKLPGIDHVTGEGLMHDWPIFWLRESREAQARMAEFAAARTRG